MQAHALILAFCLLSGLALRIRVGAPAGKYCGEVAGGVANINVTVLNQNTAALNASVFGENVGCAAEAVAYNDATKTVTFPNVNNPSDCLGGMLTEFGVDPAGISVTYDPSGNRILVNIQNPQAQFELDSCS